MRFHEHLAIGVSENLCPRVVEDTMSHASKIEGLGKGFCAIVLWSILLLSVVHGACATTPPSEHSDADLSTFDADGSGHDAGVDADASVDTDGPSCEDMSENCASQFGSLFTNTNGRADGTLVALVEPTDSHCALPNRTHVVLQVSMQGEVQRLVVSVNEVAAHTATAQLVGPGYSEGWHPDVHLDYPGQFGVHSSDFTPMSMDDAVMFICSYVEIGAPLSVFAYSDGTIPSSAHQIHRNDHYPDGAIAVNPTSGSSTYLLFRYSDQVF